MKKISIIIPVYNTEAFLKECIESILVQTYSNFEIIIINDGSKDRSAQICEYYSAKDKRIKVFHQENSGQSVARNRGISLATGDYIMFVDSDDYLCNNDALRIISEQAEDSYDIIVYAHKYNIPMNRLLRNHLNRFLALPDNIDSGESYLKKVVGPNNFYAWMPWIYVIKKEYWLANKYSFKEHIFFEDLELMWKVVANAKSLFVIKDVVYMYRTSHTVSTTKTYSEFVVQCHLEVLKNNAFSLQQLNCSDELKSVIKRTFSADFYYLLAELQNKTVLHSEKIKALISENHLLYKGVKKNTKHAFMSGAITLFGLDKGMKVIRWSQKIKYAFMFSSK